MKRNTQNFIDDKITLGLEYRNYLRMKFSRLIELEKKLFLISSKLWQQRKIYFLNSGLLIKPIILFIYLLYSQAYFEFKL